MSRVHLRGPQAISPTAHYTGYVWARNGLGPRALSTREGWLGFHALAPAMMLSGALGGPALEGMLLARHRLIDHLLAEAIEAGRIGSVVELAAGMSPRGLAFTERFPALTYVETDLPGMVARKRRALGPSAHRVEVLDVLERDGFNALAETLDPAQGLAVVSEGLLNYLAPAAVTGLWRRIARAFEGFPAGLYLSDLHVRGENGGPLETAFIAGLGLAVRGRVHLHFADAAAAEQAGRDAGFGSTVLHRPAAFAGRVADVERPGSGKVRVVEAKGPA